MTRCTRIGWIAVVLAVASCHDYSLLGPLPSADGGAVGASAGGSGVESQSGSGANDVGSAGDQGSDQSGGGAGDAADGGAAGAGGADLGVPLPSQFGTVWLSTNTTQCAGTMQHHDWVLTAGECIPDDVAPGAVLVRLGANYENPVDEAVGVEIERFSDAYGDAGVSDLALIRLNKRFVINGLEKGFHRLPFPSSTQTLPREIYCIGWDMGVAMGRPTQSQTAFFQVDQVFDGLIMYAMPTPATTLWSLDADATYSTQSMDRGGGCFLPIDDRWFQVAVQFDSVALDWFSGTPTETVWSRSSSLTDPEVRQWLVTATMGSEVIPEIAPARGIAALASGDDVIVVWITNEGTMSMATLADPGVSSDLGGPPGVVFETQRPGIGEDELGPVVVGYGDDAQLWYRRFGANETDWTVVESAVEPRSAPALANAGGQINLFARGANDELRQAKFVEGAWDGWIDLGIALYERTFIGGPFATFSNSRIELVMRTDYTEVYQVSDMAGSWYSRYIGVASGMDPIVLGSADGRMDLFVSTYLGTLSYRWWASEWLYEWMDTGIALGEHTTAFSNADGGFDVFTSDGTELTHYWWPR
jgi:hypothetical protein